MEKPNSEDKLDDGAKAFYREDDSDSVKLNGNFSLQNITKDATSHVSVVESLTDVEVQVCDTCCHGNLCHCPLCPAWLFRPADASKVTSHLLSCHWKKRFVYKGINILYCRLVCGQDGRYCNRGHWHCPLCSQIRIALPRLQHHLNIHAKGRVHDTANRRSNRQQVNRLLKPFSESQRTEGVEEADKQICGKDGKNPQFSSNSEKDLLHMSSSLVIEGSDIVLLSSRKDRKNPEKSIHFDHCPCCFTSLSSVSALLCHLYSGKCRNMVDLISRDLLRKVFAMDGVSGKECPVCDELFHNEIEMKVHFALKKCQNGWHNADGLTRNSTTGTYCCHYCDFSATFPCQVTTHMARVHLEKTCPCQVCGKKFGSNSILKEHIRLTHLTRKAPAVCHVCGMVVAEEHLQRHIHTTHSEGQEKAEAAETGDSEKSLVCELCDYMASCKELLHKHCQCSHGNKDKVCDTCGKAFASLGMLRQHAKIQHSKTMHPHNAVAKCDLCGKQMLQRNMHAHVKRVHEGMRDFICDVCQKRFQTRYTLKVHHDSHCKPENRKYKFICKICGSGFNNRTIYLDHLNVHSGNRPYVCVHCNKTFRQLTVYHKHLEVHRGVRYSCSICRQSFHSKKYVLSHLRKHFKGAFEGSKVDLAVETGADQFEPDEERSTGNNEGACALKIDNYCHSHKTTPSVSKDSKCSSSNKDVSSAESHPLPTMSAAVEVESKGTVQTTTMLDLLIQLSGHVEMSGDSENKVEELKSQRHNSHSLGDENEVQEVMDMETNSQFLCSYCQQVFGRMQDLNDHLITDHADNFVSVIKHS